MPGEMRASGGGSQSDLWCQIKADVLDLPGRAPAVRQSGCLGAALIAASGAGLAGGVASCRARARARRTRLRAAAGRAVYDELYGCTAISTRRCSRPTPRSPTCVGERDERTDAEGETSREKQQCPSRGLRTAQCAD